MPTIYQQGKYKFVIRTREPAWKRPHAHVLGPNVELSIALDDFEVLAVNGRISAGLLREFIAILQRHHEEFMQAWSDCHG